MKCLYMVCVWMLYSYVGLMLSGCVLPQSKELKDLNITAPHTQQDKTIEKTDISSHDPKQPSGDIMSPISTPLLWKKFFKNPVYKKNFTDVLAKLGTSTSVQDESYDDLKQKVQQSVDMGNYEMAWLDLQALLRRKHDDVDVMISMASVLLKQKKTIETFEVLTQLNEWIKTQSDPPIDVVLRYTYILALAQIENQDMEGGRELLKKIIISNKTFQPAYLSLTSTYIQEGKFEAAEFILKLGQDRIGPTAGFYNLLALIYEQRPSETSKVYAFYEKALELDSLYVPALINKGNFLIGLGDLKEGVGFLEKALQYEPRNDVAMVSLALVYLSSGKIEEARAFFEKAMLINPYESTGRLHLAKLMLLQYNQPEKALRLYHEVTQIKGSSTELKRVAASYIDDIRYMNLR